MEMKDTLELIRQAQDVVKSRFLLCILVTQRIHQLENGARENTKNTIVMSAD